MSSTQYARYSGLVSGGTTTGGNLTDVGTDGIVITGGTGAVLGAGTSIAQHVADTTHNGYLSSTDWNTFNSKQAALTIGNLTDVGTDGIVITGGTGAIIGAGTSIAQHVADTTHNGYLSSTDWNTFNGKGSGTVTAVSVASTNGFAGSSSGGSTPALTLSTTITGVLQGNGTAISAATTGNLTDVGTDGIVVTGGTGAVLGSGASIAQHVADTTHNGYLSSTDWNTFNGKQASGNYITALTGDVTASGPGSVGATLAATSNASLVTLSGLTTASSLVSIGTVTSGTWSATTIALNKGGTGQTTKAAAFDALSPMSAGGDIIYGGASGTGTRLANGSSGQVLTSAGGTSAPTWAAVNSGAGASTVLLSLGNGRGSTNTTVRRFTNNATTGTDLTYADSATNGMSVTVNTAGLYFVTYTDAASTAVEFGASLNSTASPVGLAVANTILRMQCTTSTFGSGAGMIKCAVNDIIRAVCETGANGTSGDIIFFVTRVA